MISHSVDSDQSQPTLKCDICIFVILTFSLCTTAGALCRTLLSSFEWKKADCVSNSGLKSDPTLRSEGRLDLDGGNASVLSAQFYDGLQLPPLS